MSWGQPGRSGVHPVPVDALEPLKTESSMVSVRPPVYTMWLSIMRCRTSASGEETGRNVCRCEERRARSRKRKAWRQ